MRQRLRSERGFGLMELVIAMMILQVAILALVAALSSGHSALLKASRESTAAALASKELEKYRSQSYATIPVGAPTTAVVAAEDSPDGRSYRIDTTFAEDATLLLKTVQVSVSDPAAPGSPYVRLESSYSHLTGFTAPDGGG